MIGTNELKASRLYEYDDNLVFVIGFGVTPSTKKIVIFRVHGSDNTELPKVVPEEMFINKANNILVSGTGFNMNILVQKEIKTVDVENE
jgi:hypothetical protein